MKHAFKTTKHDELAKALRDFVVHEPEVEPTRQGLRLNFTFRFEPDFLRFDSAQRQNELIIDPRKILLEQRLKDSGAKPSRSR